MRYLKSGNGPLRPLGLGAMRRFAKLLQDEKGATAVEYALICALIVVACMASIGLVADGTIGMWNDVSTNISNAM
jgi:pilus assembly protein Flp/PilA